MLVVFLLFRFDLVKDPSLQEIWNTFDFAWGEPDGDEGEVDDAEGDGGDDDPHGPNLVAIEDGAVDTPPGSPAAAPHASPNAECDEDESVTTTQPEQTPEEGFPDDYFVSQVGPTIFNTKLPVPIKNNQDTGPLNLYTGSVYSFGVTSW